MSACVPTVRQNSPFSVIVWFETDIFLIPAIVGTEVFEEKRVFIKMQRKTGRIPIKKALKSSW